MNEYVPNTLMID